MFELFVAGRFREYMIVALENDGPVTFIYQ